MLHTYQVLATELPLGAPACLLPPFPLPARTAVQEFPMGGLPLGISAASPQSVHQTQQDSL